jgi:eukaryotic-like serine/threonine-protein kinase
MASNIITKPRAFYAEGEVQLIRRINEGGMSVVYEAYKYGSAGFTKRVAVKMLLRHLSENSNFMKMFIDEAKLVADLVHENIVQIYHLGALDDAYYILMELVEGISMREFMLHHKVNRKRVPENLAVHLISRVVRGLAYAHKASDRDGHPLEIVHRDVCPGNILLSREGLTKLTDFGVAKAMTNTLDTNRWLTGKVPYMSPEQAACRESDYRSDIYSVGVVLFELLTGEAIRPRDADPKTQDFAAIRIPWHKLPENTGSDLRALMEKMLDPDPDRRAYDTSELATALEYYIYKDGYGPTVQTVKDYIRTSFPHLNWEGPPDPVSNTELSEVEYRFDTACKEVVDV